MPTSTPPKSSPGAGAVYTPDFLASWLAEQIVPNLAPSSTVLDFACGQGALLEAVNRSHGHQLNLIGCDIDLPALDVASRALPDARIQHLDAIGETGEGPGNLISRLEIEPVDAIVLNPPWGIKLGRDDDDLQDSGFELGGSNLDSADLFIEIAIANLRPGGLAGLIMPDSIFGLDHDRVRHHLLERTTLLSIYRLGEGIFPGIYRGCAVIVLRKSKAGYGHLVACGRLSQPDRKAVTAGVTNLADVLSSGTHTVPQSRFSVLPSSRFDIDARDEESYRLEKIGRAGSRWAGLVSSGRGIELSKHGKVVLCPNCGIARPAPRADMLWNCRCGSAVETHRAPERSITRAPTGESGWLPLISGEDVRRYQSQASREVELGVEGINYKDSVDRTRKRLLIRKTGVGLKAAIEASDALTTQTVFHFQRRDGSPSHLLEYLLAVLNSRTLLAFHLKKSGESEWRSHPYVTQATILDLPVPDPSFDEALMRRSRELADAVASGIDLRPGSAGDVHIEQLVAGMYGLDADDMDWVNGVLEDAGPMEGIVSLRLPESVRINPVPLG